jgi:L-threonylcarbamoyladenylate synthase
VELADRANVNARIEAALAAGAKVGVMGARSDDPRVVGLGVPGDGDAYAHELYRMLRAADAHGLERVIAVIPDADGLGAAVADRLRRAAGPR